MGLRFFFNPKSLEAFAKELRRASWGVALASSAGGIKLSNAWVLLTGCAGWLVLQIAAIALESIHNVEE